MILNYFLSINAYVKDQTSMGPKSTILGPFFVDTCHYSQEQVLNSKSIAQENETYF